MSRMAGKQVLITGGTGFLGQPLCRQLLAQGAQVTLLSRDPARASRQLGAGVTVLAAVPERAFDVVINLAGEPLAAGRWSAARKAEFRRSRIGTTEALLAHFRRLGQAPELLVSGSAIGYYGDRGEQVLTEAAPPGQGFGAELCRDWEAAAEAFGALGTRVCCIRTGVVLGTEGGALRQMLLPFRLGLGGPMGSGKQYMSWIHRDDWLGLVDAVLQAPDWSGACNATAPEPVPNREFVRLLGRQLRRPAVLPAPAWLLRLLLGEMAQELLLAGQRVVPQAALDRGYPFRYPSLASALQVLLP